MFLEITVIGKTKAVYEIGCQEECSSVNPQFPKKVWFFNRGLFQKHNTRFWRRTVTSFKVFKISIDFFKYTSIFVGSKFAEV
jgi:hypothetical protein